MNSDNAHDTRPPVIIVGNTFGELAAARELAAEPVRVTLIDRYSHHVFHPLHGCFGQPDWEKDAPGIKDVGDAHDIRQRFSALGHSRVSVIRDLCYVERADGRPVSGVSPTANRTGAHAAKMIIKTLRYRPYTPFKYFNRGELAPIGRGKAVAAFDKLSFSGTLWRFFSLLGYLLYPVGLRNRLSVRMQWGYAYFTYQRGVRFILNSRPAT